MTISNPKLLTKQIHKSALEALRLTLEQMKLTQTLSLEVQKIRIRNVLFIIEDGVPTIDVILDKGYLLQEEEKNLIPRFANGSLTFDECAEVHRFIMATNALDSFSDDVSVRFGSPGSEPTLFDVKDFKASLENMVRIETWEPIDGRHKYTMLLVDIFEKEGNSIAVVTEGAQRIEIPLDNIKSAFTLPFHPASKSMKLAKKGAPKSKTK